MGTEPHNDEKDPNEDTTSAWWQSFLVLSDSVMELRARAWRALKQIRMVKMKRIKSLPIRTGVNIREQRLLREQRAGNPAKTPNEGKHHVGIQVCPPTHG